MVIGELERNQIEPDIRTTAGGHALGSASEILYHPDGLVKHAQADGQPLIYVAVNYRLGLFGFAASQALTKGKHTNVGLRDQRAALECMCLCFDATACSGHH